MILVFLLLLFALAIYRIKIGANPEYLAHKQTTAINGLFVMVVFLSHSKGYLQIDGVPGRIYELFFAAIGQLSVVMFLFYSGYGLMAQYLRKKDAYLEGYLQKRVLRIWMHFAIAIVMYIIMNVALSIRYPLKTVLLSFTAWESVGNSNWYIFDILVLYMLFYLAMQIGLRIKDNIKWTMIMTWLFVILLWGVLSLTKERFWYDTLLAFPMGVTYSYYKPIIEMRVRILKTWLICFLSLFLVFGLFYFVIRGSFGVSISSVLFSLIIVLITMNMRICNRALVFLGSHVFTIYVFQRIPNDFPKALWRCSASGVYSGCICCEDTTCHLF